MKEALALHQRGRLAEAARLYEAVLAAEPNHFEALHLLGVLYVHRREAGRALALFDKALLANPASVECHYNRGIALLELGRPLDAVASYDRAIALKPDHAPAHSNRGNAYYRLDRLEEAVASYDQAIAFAPAFVDAHYNRGNALYRLGRHDEAITSYDHVVALKADHAEAHSNRGVTLFDLGQFEKAIASYDQAIALRPVQAALHANRANALRQLKRLAEAVAGYDRAIALQSDHAETFFSRGNVLYELGRLDDAIASYDQAVALEPGYAEAWSRRGFALRDLGRLEMATESYRRALALEPAADFVFGEYLHTKMQACDWTSHERDVDDLASRIVGGRRATSPFIALAILDDPSLHRRVSEAYAEVRFRAVENVAPFIGHREHDRLRIGYYSADFHDHATAYLMAELIEKHDRTRFECTAFSFGVDRQDDMRRRLVAGFDRFVDVGGRTDRDIVDLSRQLGIDIAIDLKGYTRDSRPTIFAGRCAPVQASYIGYPGTMGTHHIDYIIADRTVIPESGRRHYSEKVVWLPDCYQANDTRKRISERTPSRRDIGLGEAGFVFCCFNNSYKIQPATFESWTRILKRVPGSLMWLIEDNALAVCNLRRQAEASGVEGNRLVFSKRVGLADHLARHACADLFLDTLPYNAHTTASDALWAGLPVLTLIGSAFAGRVAASLLGAVGLSELITVTAHDYEERAVELATVPGALETVKRRLAANRRSSPLFDSTTFARHLEAACTAMYERHKRGLPPDHIEWVG